MLKSKATEDIDMPIAELAKFNEKIFYDPTIAPDEFALLGNPNLYHITQQELTAVLEKHFKADKSSGFSSMPLHLLRHMGPAGIQCLTLLFNKSAIEQLPPT